MARIWRATHYNDDFPDDYLEGDDEYGGFQPHLGIDAGNCGPNLYGRNNCDSVHKDSNSGKQSKRSRRGRGSALRAKPIKGERRGHDQPQLMCENWKFSLQLAIDLSKRLRLPESLTIEQLDRVGLCPTRTNDSSHFCLDDVTVSRLPLASSYTKLLTQWKEKDATINLPRLSSLEAPTLSTVFPTNEEIIENFEQCSVFDFILPASQTAVEVKHVISYVQPTEVHETIAIIADDSVTIESEISKVPQQKRKPKQTHLRQPCIHLDDPLNPLVNCRLRLNTVATLGLWQILYDRGKFLCPLPRIVSPC